MSHFCIAVFTEPKGMSIDKLLARYDAQLETERYVKYTKEEAIKKAREQLKRYQATIYARYLEDPDKYLAECQNEQHGDYIQNVFPQKLEWTDEQLYEDFIKFYSDDEIGPDGETYSCVNPDSKWDWWCVGGRWSGLLKLLPGRRGMQTSDWVNTAKVKDVDWDGMAASAKSSIIPYEQAMTNVPNKEFFLKQFPTEKSYMELQATFCTYAVVTPDGEWHAKGKMGWFGMSSETDEEAQNWQLSFRKKFIDAANPEWTITIVDCHI